MQTHTAADRRFRARQGGASAVLLGSEAVKVQTHSPIPVLAHRERKAAPVASRAKPVLGRGTARARAYAKTGVDALFIVEADDIAIIRAVHEAVDLLLIIGSGPMSAKRKELTALGARILLQGHQAVAAAVKALHDTYAHLFNGGAPADLKSRTASTGKIDRLSLAEEHKKARREYLQ